MAQAPDSLEEIWPSRPGGGKASPTPDPQSQAQAGAGQGSEVSPPQFDRVAEVLGPLEQVVLAADQRLGTIQQQVTVQAGEEAAHVERRVREAAVAQRQRIADLRGELTGRRTEVTARFDAILQILDEVDRDLARRAGVEPSGVQVTLTERQRVEVAHEAPTAAHPVAPPAAQPAAATAAGAPAQAQPQQRKEGRLSRWFRRSKRSEN
jgi:hypothetical protein